MATDSDWTEPTPPHPQPTSMESMDDTLRSAQQHVDAAAQRLRNEGAQAKASAWPSAATASDPAYGSLDSAVDRAKSAAGDLSANVRDQAQRATDFAVQYTTDEPVKSMLIAAGIGALVMGVLAALLRRA